MLTAVFLSIALNFDALAIGISYGIRNISIPKHSLLCISIFSIGYTLLASALGELLSKWIPPYLGGIFLIGIGVFTLVSTCFASQDFDFDASKTIDTREAVALSLALTLDSAGVALSYAVSVGFHTALPVMIGLCQLIFLSLGKKIGARIFFRREENTRAFHLISGVILTLFGVIRLVL